MSAPDIHRTPTAREIEILKALRTNQYVRITDLEAKDMRIEGWIGMFHAEWILLERGNAVLRRVLAVFA